MDGTNHMTQQNHHMSGYKTTCFIGVAPLTLFYKIGKAVALPSSYRETHPTKRKDGHVTAHIWYVDRMHERR